ncbi:MAG: AI-2E family transporter [Chloroflexota bacterium]
MRGDVWRWSGRGAGLGLGLAAVAAVVFVALNAAGVLVIVLVSVLLASGLEPFVGWVRGRVGLPRAATVLTVYAAFLVLVVTLVLVIVPAAIDQLGDFSQKLPALLDDLRTWAKSLGPGVMSSTATRLIDTVARGFGNPTAAPPDPEAIVHAGLTAADAIISAITILTLIFFWLTGHHRIQRFVLALLPMDHRAGVRDGWNEVEARLGLWVRGQLTLMVSIFAMTTVAYFALGLSNPLLLGIIAGIAELIPIVGPALGAIPALLVAAVTGRMELVLLVAAVYVAIQILEGNVLVPMVMKNAIGVPPFLVIVSLLVGGAVAGLVGALLAVPLTAALVVILERAQARETPVPLEGGAASATAPSEEERKALGTATPDSARTAAATGR